MQRWDYTFLAPARPLSNSINSSNRLIIDLSIYGYFIDYSDKSPVEYLRMAEVISATFDWKIIK